MALNGSSRALPSPLLKFLKGYRWFFFVMALPLGQNLKGEEVIPPTVALAENEKPYLWANLSEPVEDSARITRITGPTQSSPTVAPSSPIRIAFLGSWVRTGEVILHPQATLWDAIMSIGGPIGGHLGVMQVIRGNETVLQVNLSQEIPRNTTLAGLGLKSGDVFILAPNYPQPSRSGWDMFKEGLSVSLQVFALLGAVLSTYLTYTVLHDQRKL